MESKVHEGRDVKRFREMLGIKQDALTYELGEGWDQQKISLLEQKETIELPFWNRFPMPWTFPVKAFQNFDEEQVINMISNTLDNGSILNAINHNPIFYPIEQIIKLYEGKIALYERMLKEKDEMMVRLEKLITWK